MTEKKTQRIWIQYHIKVQEGKTGFMSVQERAETIQEARIKAKRHQPQWWLIERIFMRSDGTFIRKETVDKWLGG